MYGAPEKPISPYIVESVQRFHKLGNEVSSTGFEANDVKQFRAAWREVGMKYMPTPHAVSHMKCHNDVCQRPTECASFFLSAQAKKAYAKKNGPT